MEIEFIEKEHKYIDPEGNVIPSVTEILSMINTGYDKINPAVLEHAAMKGTLVHEWCEMYDYCGENEEPVPSELEPYCQAYADFIRDYKPEWTAIESVVYYNAMTTGIGYAGTADRIGFIDGKLCVVDIKTIASPSSLDHVKVCCQTAAYGLAADVWGDRYALYLKPDGKYRLLGCREYENENDFSGYTIFTKLYDLYTKIHSIGRKK